MTKIFLIRHAEAEGNLYRRMHGHYIGLVTSKGYVQIDLLKKRLKKEKIDAVFSSDLKRTADTSAAIYEPRGLKPILSEQLREVNMGVWEDSPWGYSDYYEPVMSKNFSHDPEKWKIEGGEDYYNVRRRMFEYVSEAAKNHDGGAIAVVSHGFSIRAFVCEIKGLQSHEVHKLPYCDNTAVTLLHYENGKFDVEYYGDASHLEIHMRTLENQSWWRDRKHRRNENARFEIFDEVRDKEIIDIILDDLGFLPHSDEMYTAFQEETPGGFLGINTSSGEDEKVGKVEYLFVRPESRRNTIGVQILGQAVSVFRKMGKEKLQMEVQKGSPAFNFCKKYGFKTVNQTRGSSCLMEKDLWSWK